MLALLLVACAESTEPGQSLWVEGCPLTDGYAWAEDDGGTCGSFDELSAGRRAIPCTDDRTGPCSGTVRCEDGSAWTWQLGTSARDWRTWVGTDVYSHTNRTCSYHLTRSR